jgi:hypothetical protein
MRRWRLPRAAQTRKHLHTRVPGCAACPRAARPSLLFFGPSEADSTRDADVVKRHRPETAVGASERLAPPVAACPCTKRACQFRYVSPHITGDATRYSWRALKTATVRHDRVRNGRQTPRRRIRPYRLLPYLRKARNARLGRIRRFWSRQLTHCLPHPLCLLPRTGTGDVKAAHGNAQSR